MTRAGPAVAESLAEVAAAKDRFGMTSRPCREMGHVSSCEDPMRASGGQGRVSLVDRKTSRRIEMTQFARPTPAAADYDSTIIGALELSEKKWVLAVQLPGVKRHSRHVVEARGDELAAFVERLKARCAVAGHNIKRVILTHEAGRDGFWLARFLARRGVEIHVMQPPSLLVDRRARRAKTDVIDVEMLLRTLMAWLRGEPRVCSMVPIPTETDEEARRAHRERGDLPGTGSELATLLVREGFSRPISNRRALGSYAGLAGTPFSSGGSEHEQGIGKDGNRRVRAAMVELAWLWLRWQPDSTLSAWFRERVGKAGGRIKKIMIVALARKLLVALWRYAKDGVIPEGAKMKTA